MHVDASPNLSPGLTPSGETSEIDQLKRYVRAIRLRWPVVVAVALLAAMIGWFTTPNQAVEQLLIPRASFYQATHTLITQQAMDPGLFDDPDGQRVGLNLNQVAFLATTGEVPGRVAERMGTTPEAITSAIRTVPRPDVSSLEITAVANESDEAVLLADAMAAELTDYVDELVEQRYSERRDTVLTRIDELEAEREALEFQLLGNPADADIIRAQLDSVIGDYRLAQESMRSLARTGTPSGGLSTIEAASAVAISEEQYSRTVAQITAGPDYVPPASDGSSQNVGPSKPPADVDPKVRAGVGGVLGLLAGLVIVIMLDRYDTRLRRRVDVELTAQLPVLAEVPPLTRRQQNENSVLSFAAPRSPTAEAFRVIRTALFFHWGEQEGEVGPARPGEAHVVMITSASPGEGKTTTVANLAAVLAEGGQSVLVVDCDFRRPAIEGYLAHAEADESAAEALATGLPSPGSRLVATDIARVKLITGFGDNQGELKPVEVVESLRRVVDVARRHFDIVLLDTAPMLTTNDASDLMPEVDTLLFLVRNGSTRREKAFRACEFLRRLDAPVLGVIFNAADETPATYYYYGYVDSSSQKRRRRGRGGTSEVNEGEAATVP